MIDNHLLEDSKFLVFVISISNISIQLILWLVSSSSTRGWVTTHPNHVHGDVKLKVTIAKNGFDELHGSIIDMLLVGHLECLNLLILGLQLKD